MSSVRPSVPPAYATAGVFIDPDFHHRWSLLRARVVPSSRLVSCEAPTAQTTTTPLMTSSNCWSCESHRLRDRTDLGKVLQRVPLSLGGTSSAYRFSSDMLKWHGGFGRVRQGCITWPLAEDPRPGDQTDFAQSPDQQSCPDSVYVVVMHAVGVVVVDKAAPRNRGVRVFAMKIQNPLHRGSGRVGKWGNNYFPISWHRIPSARSTVRPSILGISKVPLS